MATQALPEFEPRREVPLDKALALIADSRAPVEARLDACEQLVLLGMLAQAEPLLQELARSPASASRARRLLAASRYVARLAEWADFGGTPPAGAPRWETLDGSPPDKAAGESGVLLWTRADAAKTLLAFSTLRGGFGPLRGWTSIALLHRFLRNHAINVVYIRDETRCLSLAGNRDLGADYAACVVRLRQLLDSRRWSEAYALGLSAGGYPALRYGLDLALRAVLSFSGPTQLDPGAYGDIHAKAPHMAVDLLPLLRTAARRPQMLLCYGEGHAEDSAHAQRLAELSETELVPFVGYAGHSTFAASLIARTFDPLVARLLGSGSA